MKLIPEYDKVDCGGAIAARIETSPAMITPKAGVISWTYHGSPITPDWVDATTIKQATAMLRKHYANVKRAVKAGRKSMAYKMIADECKRLCWPTHYKTDLTWHDARFLGEHPNVQNFLFSVRPSGTNIYANLPGWSYGHSMLSYDATQNSEARIYYVHGDDIAYLSRDMVESVAYSLPTEA